MFTSHVSFIVSLIISLSCLNSTFPSLFPSYVSLFVPPYFSIVSLIYFPHGFSHSFPPMSPFHVSPLCFPSMFPSHASLIVSILCFFLFPYHIFLILSLSCDKVYKDCTLHPGVKNIPKAPSYLYINIKPLASSVGSVRDSQSWGLEFTPPSRQRIMWDWLLEATAVGDATVGG